MIQILSYFMVPSSQAEGEGSDRVHPVHSRTEQLTLESYDAVGIVEVMIGDV